MMNFKLLSEYLLIYIYINPHLHLQHTATNLILPQLTKGQSSRTLICACANSALLAHAHISVREL